MKRFKNILVATDTRLDEHPIVTQAAEIASQNKAALKIVDVVPEFSWIARKTTNEFEKIRDLYSQETNEKLKAIAAPIRDQGIDVETKLMVGKTSVEIIREVIRGEHDLVISVAKGQGSKRAGYFGQTARGLLRQCPSAVWLVTPGTTRRFKHILGCVDAASEHASDVELNDKVFELASSISEYDDSHFSILYAWVMDDEAVLSFGLDSQAVAEFVADDRQHRQNQFNKFLSQHESSTDSENVHMIKGRVPEVIATFVQEHEVDLVVMGTVARSRLSGMFIGNTAEKILDRIECSVVALKPYRFKSPINVA